MDLTELIRYFSAEKQAALLLLVLALAGMVSGVYLRITESFFRAMAWPLFTVAVIQTAVGIGLLMRTNPQVAALQQGFTASPATAVAAEITRMDKVNRAWILIEVVEVMLIVAGLILIFAGRSAHPAWTAFGMGLLIEASVMLAFDLFAEHRALVYTEWLKHF